jgi:nicotinamidase/pyrazinamidase
MGKDSIHRNNLGVVLVDFQVDFTEEKQGSLAVPGTDGHYIMQVSDATIQFFKKNLPIYATQDWHPASHLSFHTNNPGTNTFDVIEVDGRSQIMWPPHCVQGTKGADILIDEKLLKQIIKKGMHPRFDSYSGFADDGGNKTQLEKILNHDRVTELIIYGLATDHCIKATVLDAIKAGFRVHLLLDLCRGVLPETTAAAIEKMRTQGADIIEKSAFNPGQD